MKKILNISILLSSILLADDNLTKKQIFENKYLQDKAKMQNQISVDELHENTKNFNLNNLRHDDINISKFQKENKEFIDINQTNQKINNTAKEISDYRRSDSFNKEVTKNEKYILYDKSINFNEYLGQYSDYTKKMIEDMENTKHNRNTNQYLNSDEKIFIVISSSLEKSVIQNYFKLLEKVNTDVTFVLRGLVGNDLRYINPTRLFIQDLLIKDPNNKNKEDKNNYYYFNIEINPKITQRFNITRVPAVIYIQNYNSDVQDYKDFIGNPDENEKYYVAYGQTSVDYALKEINKEVKSKGLERLLDNMSQNYFK